MTYSAIIVDDEHNGSESLELLIKAYCPELEIKAIVDNVDAAVLAVEQFKPAILFLDIEMPSGSGFEVVERTKHLKYKVIFTTAYEQYALKALKLNAIDYLLKPISIEELIKAVNKAISNTETKFANLAALIEQLNPKVANSKIAIPCSEGLLFVETEKIIRLEADSNYTDLFLIDGRRITASKTLKDFEKVLEPGLFFRIHSAHLINIQKVEKYVKGDGGHVVLIDSSCIPVSRAQKLPFLSALNRC